MDERALAQEYAPIMHFDSAETIPLRAIGYSVIRQDGISPSFRRQIKVCKDAECVAEYAYYWDYDIQHMYDLEHIWVTVGADGQVLSAEGSFHGKYLVLWQPDLLYAPCPDGRHVHAFCQPGKHAFLPDGQLFRLIPDWREACNKDAGGGVLVGYPFQGVYSPTEDENELSARYIKQALTFEPTMAFGEGALPDAPLMPWEELRKQIPAWIRLELERIRQLEANDV